MQLSNFKIYVVEASGFADAVKKVEEHLESNADGGMIVDEDGDLVVNSGRGSHIHEVRLVSWSIIR